MRLKVTVVGAGNVGATTAQRIYERGYADVVLVNVVEDMLQVKALDLLESGPVLGTDAQINGANDYEPTAGPDLDVTTAGIAQMLVAILLDRKEILPCAAMLDGEYGISGLYVGVPVKLGAGGVEEELARVMRGGGLTLIRKNDATQREKR